MTVVLPKLKWVPSPNHYAGGNAPVRLVVWHDCEGSYAGSVSWFAQKQSEVSAHFVLKEDGTEATQCVAYADAAWHAKAFNRGSVALEMGGVAKRGFPDVEVQAAANIVAYLLHRFKLPCRWAEKGEGQGFCRHYDLGAAGGGHYDPVTDLAGWQRMAAKVEAAYKAGVPATWAGER